MKWPEPPTYAYTSHTNSISRVLLARASIELHHSMYHSTHGSAHSDPADRARHKCAVALATFPFHKGRASATLRKKLFSWLVDVHHHDSTVIHFQVSPCVGGRPESHSVTTKTPSATVTWGRATEPSVPRWRRQIPIFCRPKDSRRRKSVPTTANACLKPAGSFKLHDRPTRRRPYASERSPVSSLDLLKRAISLHSKEICTIREG